MPAVLSYYTEIAEEIKQATHRYFIQSKFIRMKKIMMLLMMLFALFSCKKEEIANIDCKPYVAPADAYHYPVLPGTPEWLALGTTEARWQACQIPDNVLNTISTDGLVQGWLDMPLNNEVFSANSLQRAMEFYIGNFSGLRELVKRNDAGEKLFGRYQMLSPSCIENYPTLEGKANYSFLFIYAGLLLGQDTVLNKMPLQQKKQLVAEALKKATEQQAYYDAYGKLGLENCCFICAKVMYNCNYQPFIGQVDNEIRWFLDNALFYIPAAEHGREINIIINAAKSFIY